MVVAEREDLLAPDLDKYRGKWVAIKDGKVMASADSPTDLLREVAKRHLRKVSLHKVPDDSDVAYLL